MDELIEKVAERAGINSDQAQKAVATVVDHLKDRLPAPLAGQLESLVGGDDDGKSGSGGIGDALKGLGGLGR